jgi:hypothetical protein
VYENGQFVLQHRVSTRSGSMDRADTVSAAGSQSTAVGWQIQ